MADFAAVLKKTIDAQKDQSPELRQRVYAKARSTIEQKLLAANASEAVSTRQREMLDSAIAEVEAFYAPPAIEPEAEPVPSIADAPEASVHEEPVHEEPAIKAPVAPAADPLDEFLKSEDRTHRAAEPTSVAPDIEAFDSQDDGAVSSPQRGDEWKQDRDDEAKFTRKSAAVFDDEGPSRSYKGLITALVAVLVLGGVGYAGWSNKDRLQELASSLGRNDAPTQVPGTDVTPKPEQSAALPTTPEVEDGKEPTPEPKLTQRLLADGSEVDEGPAGGQASVGEGSSTTASTTGTDQPKGATPPPAGVAVPVGQQALFYEERSGQEASSVEKSTVVWSVIQDSPGEGEPEEPAIRADVTVPDSEIGLRMTIRRNTDKSIPASHLFEMVFTVPEDFQGGAIDNVQRVAFKETEQAAGNPLVAVPFKVADNFFIVALNDARTAVDTNMSLMRRQQWIDIPITYRNGRRALLSLEKGVPGDKVFEEVLKGWTVPAATNTER